MKYGYTEVSDIVINVQMTAHDIQRLIKIVEDYTGEDNKWFASNTAATLRDCLNKSADAMIGEGQYLKERNNA
jgi:frataxin-like iron-binding protein CyaY